MLNGTRPHGISTLVKDSNRGSFAVAIGVLSTAVGHLDLADLLRLNLVARAVILSRLIRFGWARWRLLEYLKMLLCLSLLIPTVVRMNYHGRLIRDDKVRRWCHIKVA